jgi:hypothetical protein
MDRRGADAKVPLHLVFCWWNAMHVYVLGYKCQILSLLFGEFRLVSPPALRWAEDINHFATIKNNDVFLVWVTTGLNQPLTLSFALLLNLVYCVFAEVYLMAAVTEIRGE